MKRAFTLIELIVVTAILAVVMAALGSCLAGGIRAWDAVKKFNSGELETVLGLAMLGKDVCNTMRFHDIPFEGDSGWMSFPAILRKSSDELNRNNSSEMVVSLGTVKYYVDPNMRALVRKQWFYPYHEPTYMSGEIIASDVKTVALKYFRLPHQTGEDNGNMHTPSSGEWLDCWSDSTNLPGGLSIELIFTDEHRDPMTRIVLIPAAEASKANYD
ncbi:MAG: type II secretion system protein [Lentisphaerae bacterium]|nr:type II secretion system protein [Lentisphaerota bacterium]